MATPVPRLSVLGSRRKSLLVSRLRGPLNRPGAESALGRRQFRRSADGFVECPAPF